MAPDAHDGSRLPTPAPSDSAGPSSALLAPPPPSSITKSPSSLSVAFSNVSSLDDSFPDRADSRFISALPSPSISVSGSTYSFPDTVADESRPGSPPAPVSGGSKTSSFFATSFALLPPSLLPQRSTSLSVRGKHAGGDNSSAYGSLQQLPPTRYPQLGHSSSLGHGHPRSASAERDRTPQSTTRSESGNSIFFTNIAAPTPPPPLRSSTPEPGPSSPPRAPRAFEVEERLRETPRAPPRGEGALFAPVDRKRPPPIAPAPRRRIILLDDDDPFHASPVPSPVTATFSDQSPPSTASEETPSAQRHPLWQDPPAEPPPLAHLHREPASTLQDRVHPVDFNPGDTLVTPEPPVVSLRLVRLLGKGAFSSVWLCSDPHNSLGPSGPQERRKSESVAKRRGDRKMAGIMPRLSNIVRGEKVGRERDGSIVLDEADGEGATTPVLGSDEAWAVGEGHGRLVAVKMLDKAMCDANDRTRISFVREVEVLRHIHHPSIVSYVHSFTTPTHHCLVLEYLSGGELFSMLDDDDKYSRLSEPLLRRMFGELARAVGWMHGVALVHRDIKLENIILTCDPFAGGSTPSLDHLPSPLLKLTDFGLSRFIDTHDPLLHTRCGSESYAAPEIVMGKPYDGRQTDAWACGVVLYALATRTLPFDSPTIGRGQDEAEEARNRRRRAANEGRKAYLFRIAKGDYTWPKEPSYGLPTPLSAPATNGTTNGNTTPRQAPLSLATPGLKQVVGRLLVRDPAKRARVVDLWEEEWMKGEGAPNPPHRDSDKVKAGHLVDGDSIGDVARQELV